MAIIVGDCTDGVRTGLSGRIANAIVASFAGTTYPVGKNWTNGLNSLVTGIVNALNLDKIAATQMEQKGFGSTGQAGMATSITSVNGWTTMGGLTFSYTAKDTSRAVKTHMTASAFVSVAAPTIQFRVLMDGATVIVGPFNWTINAATSHSQWAIHSVSPAGTVPAGAHTMAFQIQVTTVGVTLTQDSQDSFSIVMEEAG